MKRSSGLFVLALLLSLSALPARANPFEGAAPVSGGMEFSIVIDLLPQGELPAGFGFEFNTLIGTSDSIGFTLLIRDWTFIGLTYAHSFDFLESRYLAFPLKARAGYFSYYGDDFWGGTLGAGIRGYYNLVELIATDTSRLNGTGFYGCAELMASLVVHTRTYYGSYLEFLPEAALPSVIFIGDLND